VPDAYVVDIASNDAIEPDAGVLADVDVSDYLRARFYKSGRRYLWHDTFVRSDHKYSLKGQIQKSRLTLPLDPTGLSRDLKKVQGPVPHARC
jgi:hypothetical protein